jgi:hypothetical protein
MPPCGSIKTRGGPRCDLPRPLLARLSVCREPAGPGRPRSAATWPSWATAADAAPAATASAVTTARVAGVTVSSSLGRPRRRRARPAACGSRSAKCSAKEILSPHPGDGLPEGERRPLSPCLPVRPCRRRGHLGEEARRAIRAARGSKASETVEAAGQRTGPPHRSQTGCRSCDSVSLVSALTTLYAWPGYHTRGDTQWP